MQETFWRADDADTRIPQTPLCLAARKCSRANHLCV
jgi:hypothetical protein